MLGPLLDEEAISPLWIRRVAGRGAYRVLGLFGLVAQSLPAKSPVDGIHVCQTEVALGETLGASILLWDGYEGTLHDALQAPDTVSKAQRTTALSRSGMFP